MNSYLCHTLAAILVSTAAQAEPDGGALPEEQIQRWQANLTALGTYHVKIRKRERFDGKLQDWQTLDALVSQKPVAVRIEYVAGPGKGRKVLYNELLRKGELRVRESGLLSIAGALWLDINGKLSRGDTHHSVRETGFGSVIDIVRKDAELAQAQGGEHREEEPPDTHGARCSRFDAPPGAKGLYAKSSRICTDPVLGLPTGVRVSDAAGVFEEYEFTDVKANAADDKAFTLEAAGL